VTRFYRNPGFAAVRLIERVRDGDIQTPGQWTDAADTLAALPPRLQEWTIGKLTPLIGEDGVSYVLSFASTPRPVYTKVPV